jgi:hypothetical protein
VRADSSQNAIRRTFHFQYSFVGFHFEKRLTFAYTLAFPLPPGHQLAGFLRHLERGHHNAEGHSSISGSWGILDNEICCGSSARVQIVHRAVPFRITFSTMPATIARATRTTADSHQRDLNGSIRSAKINQITITASHQFLAIHPDIAFLAV